ncbi:MAG: hypothetical protein KDK37_17605 [Leptospiraceae bacterium]|nr:hypothetical protein [Leptospiraceae bacterium]
MMDIDALLDSLLTSRGGCAADYRILLLSSIHGLGVEIQKRNPGRTVRCLILRDTGSTDREFRDFARQHACHVEDVYSTEELMGELAQTEASVNPEAAG